MNVRQLLVYAKKSRASDLHISSGNMPTLRVDGKLVPIPNTHHLLAEQAFSFITDLMTTEEKQCYEENKELDFAVQVDEDVRFRVNAFYTVGGPAAAFRDISSGIKTFADLGLPPLLEKLASLHKGLVLVTGPTGSGKSTTLSALIHHINNNFHHHVITIEDPVEFVHKSIHSLINQREVGKHTESFATALRSSLREDPDVVMVGEMRDLETMSLALTAAETGNLVLGTLHTNSAPQTINRIIDMFPSGERDVVRSMLSTSLQAIISQQLLLREGGGRVAATEILLCTGSIRNLIREGKIQQIYSAMQINSKLGMQTMEDAVNALLAEGTISQKTANTMLISVSQANN